MANIRKLGILLMFVMTLSSCMSSSHTFKNNDTSARVGEKQQLTIKLVGRYSGDTLPQKIQRFADMNSNVEIKIEWVQSYNNLSSKSLVLFAPWTPIAVPSELYENSNHVPDIVELVPNQMRELYRMGVIEPLNMNESDIDDYTIATNDGYVLGIKSKINPMILYYNKDIFSVLGIEVPSEKWDITMLNEAIVKLKAAGETVYIPLSPFTLEWATGLYGGRVVGVDGRSFAGYIDSDDAVKAAKWIMTIGTKIEYASMSLTDLRPPMPYDLVDGKIALAIEYAYGFNISMKNSYEEIAQENKQIGVAALPEGTNGLNPALISGLSITSKSAHKELAMQLIRYLSEDRDSLYTDIASHTLQTATRTLKEPVDAARKSIIIKSMKRSIPAILYTHEEAEIGFYDAIQLYLPKPLLAIRNGQSLRDMLKQYADQLDSDSRDK